jgi:hypothetical membrane protein
MTNSASPQRWHRGVILGWLVSMVAFTATWAVLGFFNDGYTLYGTVIEDYSPIHQPISGLGLGSTAVAMNTTFVVYGLVAIAGAVTTAKLLAAPDPALPRPTLITFGLHGVGSVLVGVFTLESMEMHSIGFLGVLAPIVGFLFIGRRLARHDQHRTLGNSLLRIAAPLSLLLLAGFFASFNPEAAGEGHGVAGLTQRVLIVNIQIWAGAIAIFAARHAQQIRQQSQA